MICVTCLVFFFSSRRRHTRCALVTEFRRVLFRSFRTMLFRMIEAGWEIDYAKVEAEWDRKVYVIPSPERRKDPKNWVHEAVPMTRPRDPDFGWHALAAEVCQPVAESSE